MSLTQPKPSPGPSRLDDVTLPNGAGWAVAARKAALGRAREMGLPTRRDEYWKYTNPQGFIQKQAAPADVPSEFDGGFDHIDRLNIVFVDGVFDPKASDKLTGEGLTIERLSAVSDSDIHWVKDLYGVLETSGQTPVKRPLAALNTACATDGVVICATGKVSKPVLISYLRKSESADVHLHHVIRVDEGASLTVLETGAGAARMNTVMELDIAENSAFNHIRVQGLDQHRRIATHQFARLSQQSAFKSFTLSAAGVLTRNETVIELTGDNAIAHVGGAAVGDGDFQHDDTVFITHDGEACESRQVYKKVLRNGATGVFQGKILVNQKAQKTDGYQISQSLLLGDNAQFLAKPELEIYADDVICSHGSTSGAIDEEALFYLRSRGIPSDQAQDLLVLAFLAKAIDEIEDQDIAETILERLESWLALRNG